MLTVAFGGMVFIAYGLFIRGWSDREVGNGVAIATAVGAFFLLGLIVLVSMLYEKRRPLEPLKSKVKYSLLWGGQAGLLWAVSLLTATEKGKGNPP